MVRLVRIAFVLRPRNDVSATHNMTGWIRTKYTPPSCVRSLDFSGFIREGVVLLEFPLD